MNTVILVFAVLMVFFGIAALFEKLLGRPVETSEPFVSSYQDNSMSVNDSQETAEKQDDPILDIMFSPTTGMPIGTFGSPCEEALGIIPNRISSDGRLIGPFGEPIYGSALEENCKIGYNIQHIPDNY